ncbi:putative methyltransferase-domain-containing protein [Mycena sanguinolenta]|nr:putative methyltransferase-domain-containing protein [Mycena sanguinolenta]
MDSDDERDPLNAFMQGSGVSVVPDQLPSVRHGEKLQLSFSGADTTITVDLILDSSPGCGGVAWPAGEVLSQYLVDKLGPESLRGKKVLELGSGTGLVGLVAAMLGGTVYLTDQAPLLNIMRENVEINQLSSFCVVEELNWGEPIPAQIPKPDVVLAADCVYFEPAFPLLVQTLCDLVDEGTEVLFCYKKRRKGSPTSTTADKRFFALLKKKFQWSDVPDEPASAIYSRESISLLRLTKL